MDYKKHIRSVPDFPKKGILFYDITTLLENADAFSSIIDDMIAGISKQEITKIAGIESRGFIFGAAIALKLGKPFVLIRKPGKLPYEKIKVEYQLEYGSDGIEIHEDAVSKEDKVLIVDDLLATGGTVNAATELIKKCGAEVAAIVFAIELSFLNGAEKLKNYKVKSIVKYDS